MSNEASPLDRASTDNTGQHTILAQAQAAVEAEDRIPPTEQPLWHNADLIAEETSADVPPPYGQAYGEIHNEKHGFGTSAVVSDDGRVNIRINQLNRRLSQIFHPGLLQQLQSDAPPYIPPGLEADGGKDRPPSLNIVIQIVGSRGDVQPFIALAKVLRDQHGHRVRIATHPTFKDFIQKENGLEFFSIGGDPSRLMAFMVKNPGLVPGFGSLLAGDVTERRRDVAEYIQGCWRSCYQPGDGMGDGVEDAKPFVADCIIANPPSFAHIHCAERLGVPLHIMFTMPYSPTQAFPHPLANVQASNADAALTNYLTYSMIDVLTWQSLGGIINRFRVKCLGLDPISLIWAPGMLQRLQIPHTYCWSPALIPKPQDWGAHVSLSGYFLDSPSDYTPSTELQKFLDAGSPPVYIGFGSIVLADPKAMTELIFEAAKITGQRVLLSKGWGGMGTAEHAQVPGNVYTLDSIPHDWLFKHVSCVVHHGGAGTTAAGMIAGKPTLVVPFFGDQPFWGSVIAKAGAGPNPIPHKQLTADKLAAAIDFCLRPETVTRAKELADRIAAERGCETGANLLHHHLDVDRLRCMLAPSRATVWRLKRSKIRLSGFAACTLANAGLLDFHDLKLFRAQEYITDEGPWDPISGLAAAMFGAIGTMVLGVADLPSEAYKTARMPADYRRRQASRSTNTLNAASVSQSIQPGKTTDDDKTDLTANTLDAGSAASDTASQISYGKQYDFTGQTGPSADKGIGRMFRAGMRAPMDMSVEMTKGFHNAPKLWGDDTVRPQQKVKGIKSGTVAIGKEFGLGFYDGVSGLATQPWNGARKEGATGFFKGVGKGLAGFVVKPGAALFGIPAYLMKGFHKEFQKLYGHNVQSYIVASRTAQGYDDWLQSSEVEKQEVIEQWKSIQKYLKKKHTTDDMLQDMLETNRQQSSINREANAVDARSVLSSTADAGSLRFGDRATLSGSRSSQESALNAGVDKPDDGKASQTVEEIAIIHPALREEQADAVAGDDDLRRAVAASQAEARRAADDTAAHEYQLKTAMAASMAVSASTGQQQPPAYDFGHLEGTTQSEYAAQQAQRTEKMLRERTEEEIVLEYIKKQSLLETEHRGSSPVDLSAPIDRSSQAEGDEDLAKALQMSLQES